MSYWQSLKFWSDTRGHMAIIFTLALPALLAMGGLAVDYAAWTGQARRLQTIADISALTAAKELYLANVDEGQVSSVADSVAQAQLALDDTHNAPISVSAQVTNDGDSVEVVLSQDRKGIFANFMVSSLTPLQSRAVARAVGGGRLCVLALDESASTALDMSQEGEITAPTCAVYSNATGSAGIDLSNKAQLTAELICSAGGADGSSSAYAPSATTDCPQVDDPLAGRPAPSVGACDFTNFKMKNGRSSPLKVLQPGVYCGGLAISGGEVVFEPGIYVIKDGELWINSGAQISGENVGIYFAGAKTNFYLESNSVVNLTAPKDGPMAGILFFQDRNANDGVVYEISSNQASILLGTIYLPHGELAVSSNARVADQSAWTAIIVQKLTVSAKSDLVLNTGYGQTDIPVPSGVNQAGGTIVLEK